MASVTDDEWVDADEWEDVGVPSVADAARARLKARSVNPKVPVDADAARNKIKFIDTLHEVADKGPNPFQYALAGARALGLPRTMKEFGTSSLQNAIVPGGSAMMGLVNEVRDIPRRVQGASAEFRDDPARQAAMTTAGALPLVGGPLQSLMRPSFMASERPVTDDERLGAAEGAVALGGFAAGKAKGVVPGGGEWSAADPTSGVRAKLSMESAPQILRNMSRPAKGSVKFGADPGEFLVGLKAERGGGIESINRGKDVPKKGGGTTYEPGQVEAKLAGLNAKADQIAYNTTEGRSVPIDYEGALRKAFEPHIARAVRGVHPELAPRLQAVLAKEIEALHKATGHEVIGPDGAPVWVDGPGVAPARIGRRYHQDLGDLVRRFTEDPVEGTVQSAYQDAWVAIKEKTGEAVPALRDVNQQIHSGIEAEKSLWARTQEERNAPSMVEPGSWLSHPIRSALGATVKSPWWRTRYAAGLRSLSPIKEPPGPPILDVGPMAPLTGSDPVLREGGVPGSVGGENVPWRAGVRRPADEQRALPPAPVDAPEGFISSDELRRVGTRLGQQPEQDAAVFAPQNMTGGMRNVTSQPQEMSPNAPWFREQYARSRSPLYDLAAEGDFRNLSRDIRATRAEGFLSGEPAGRVNPRLPDWMTNEVPPLDMVQVQVNAGRPLPSPDVSQPPPPQSAMARDMATRPSWADSLLQRNRATQQAMTELSKHVRPEHAGLPIGELLRIPNYQQMFQQIMRGIAPQP